MRILLGLVAAGIVGGVTGLSGAVRAAPLDQAACDAATSEQSKLTDVPAILERGPEWAKTNAPPKALQRVARWIELQEQLSFRCGRGRVTAEAQRAGAAADLLENPPPAPPPVPAIGDKPAAAKEAVAPAVAAPVAPAVSADEATAAQPKAAKPKLKSKPKAVNDAEAAAGQVAPHNNAGDVVAAPPKRKRVAKPDAAKTQDGSQPAATQTN
ncbi:MAG: hypothetical protein ABL901_06245 [Hyphomicrobiaceae bacterium]